MDSVHLFLGSNSGEGFCSLYDQLPGARFDDLMILKGGPGCGKSSFMRRVAKALTGASYDCVYIHCSGDPDSLDAVIFPQLRAGIVDGTSPHVLEPEYTVAHDRYVDLTRFYDVEAVKARRADLVALSDAYRGAYREAYRCLRAAEAVATGRRDTVAAVFDGEKLERRVLSILRRELRSGPDGAGGEVRAFLGGVTHQGTICRFDTVEALCPRVFELSDSFGLAADALEALRKTALRAGCRVLACPDPLAPQRLRHLLLPELGAAFVTSGGETVYPGKPTRRLRVDAAAMQSLSRVQRARLRFTGRVERSLRADAVEALVRAKQLHDALEAAYNPFVDFDGVYRLADEEAARLLSR